MKVLNSRRGRETICKKLAVYLLAAVAASLSHSALAGLIQYEFTADFDVEIPPGGGLVFDPPDIFGLFTSAQGSFTYDPDAAVGISIPLGCCTGNFDLYFPVTNFEVTVDGNTITAATSAGLVGDNVLLGAALTLTDLLLFNSFTASGSGSLSDLAVGDWDLTQMVLFFNDIASITGGTALDFGLPDELVIADYSFTGLNFTFVNRYTEEVRVSQFSPLTLVAVPEPSTLALLAAGLLGLFMRRKRIA